MVSFYAILFSYITMFTAFWERKFHETIWIYFSLWSSLRWFFPYCTLYIWPEYWKGIMRSEYYLFLCRKYENHFHVLTSLAHSTYLQKVHCSFLFQFVSQLEGLDISQEDKLKVKKVKFKSILFLCHLFKVLTEFGWCQWWSLLQCFHLLFEGNEPSQTKN